MEMSQDYFDPILKCDIYRISKMKQFKGKVISTKMDKTVVVEVSRRVRHPIYRKIYTQRKKYHVDDKLEVKEGDLVKFVETRPISKTKRWKIVEILR